MNRARPTGRVALLALGAIVIGWIGALLHSSTPEVASSTQTRSTDRGVIPAQERALPDGEASAGNAVSTGSAATTAPRPARSGDADAPSAPVASREELGVGAGQPVGPGATAWGRLGSVNATAGPPDTSDRSRSRDLQGATIVWFPYASIENAWTTPRTKGLQPAKPRRSANPIILGGVVHAESAAGSAQSDDLGRYRLEGLPVGERILFVVMPRDGVPQAFEFLALEAGEHRRDLELILDQVQEIRAIESTSRAPVADVEVYLESSPTGLYERVPLGATNQDGLLSVRFGVGDAPLPLELDFRRTGYLPVETRPIADAGWIEMVRALRVHGVITDPSGAPQLGVTVMARPLESPSLSFERSHATSTGNDGRYQLELPTSTSSWQVHALRFVGRSMMPPGGRLLGTIAHEAADDVRLDGVIDPVRTIAGVLRVGGVPMRGQVSWSMGGGSGYRGDAHTEADGSFSIPGLPLGVVDLTACVDKPKQTMDRRLEIGSSNELRADFDFPAPAGRISGRVVDPTGVGAEGVLVSVEHGSQAQYVARTDANGTFTIHLPPEPGRRYRVSIVDRGKTRTQFSIPVGTEDLRFVIGDE